MANANLSQAKRAKNDEFYTQYGDIEREVNAYLEFDPDVFRGKTVLLPCDDPEWSNFTRYFAQNFERLGLTKLISTSYAPDSKKVAEGQQPSLFETGSPQFDPTKAVTRGKIFTVTSDVSGDGRIDWHDLQWDYLEGDGNFRSPEVTALRDQADVIVTNPPFSLFREFLAWIMDAGKRFLILGNMNAITYKECFPLIRDNLMWLGVSKGARTFTVPDGPDQTLGNTTWFTNLDHGRRHQPLMLMSEADNIRYSRHKQVRGVGYRRYDNYDAIEVPFVEAIPADYDGAMGVPISFLDKYNPEQFEILSLTQTWSDMSTKTYPKQTLVSADGSRKVVGALNSNPAFRLAKPPVGAAYYEVPFGGPDAAISYYVSSYKRILIKHRKPANEASSEESTTARTTTRRDEQQAGPTRRSLQRQVASAVQRRTPRVNVSTER